MEILKKIDSPYDYFDSKVKNLREKIESFAANGFEENIEVFLMAMWIREKLTELTIKQGSYNLQVHAIEIPESIDQVLKQRRRKQQEAMQRLLSMFLYLNYFQTIDLEHLH